MFTVESEEDARNGADARDGGVAPDVALGGFDFDDLGAHVGENHAADGSGDDLSEIENTVAFQHFRHNPEVKPEGAAIAVRFDEHVAALILGACLDFHQTVPRLFVLAHNPGLANHHVSRPCLRAEADFEIFERIGPQPFTEQAGEISALKHPVREGFVEPRPDGVNLIVMVGVEIPAGARVANQVRPGDGPYRQLTLCAFGEF